MYLWGVLESRSLKAKDAGSFSPLFEPDHECFHIGDDKILIPAQLKHVIDDPFIQTASEAAHASLRINCCFRPVYQKNLIVVHMNLFIDYIDMTLRHKSTAG